MEVHINFFYHWWKKFNLIVRRISTNDNEYHNVLLQRDT